MTVVSVCTQTLLICLSFPKSLIGNSVFLASSGCPITNFGHDKNQKHFMKRLKLIPYSCYGEVNSDLISSYEENY